MGSLTAKKYTILIQDSKNGGTMCGAGDRREGLGV